MHVRTALFERMDAGCERLVSGTKVTTNSLASAYTSFWQRFNNEALYLVHMPQHS